MNGLFDLGRPPAGSGLCVLIDRGHREMPIVASFIGQTSIQTSDTEIVEVHLREVDGDERGRVG